MLRFMTKPLVLGKSEAIQRVTEASQRALSTSIWGIGQRNAFRNCQILDGPVRTWKKTLGIRKGLLSFPKRDKIIPHHAGQGGRSWIVTKLQASQPRVSELIHKHFK